MFSRRSTREDGVYADKESIGYPTVQMFQIECTTPPISMDAIPWSNLARDVGKRIVPKQESDNQVGSSGHGSDQKYRRWTQGNE